MSARKIITTLIVAISLNMLEAMGSATPSHTGEAASAMEAPPDTVKGRKARFSVRHTAVQDKKDLKDRTADLRDPDNISTSVTYDERDDTYTVGTTLGGTASQGAKGTAGGQSGAGNRNNQSTPNNRNTQNSRSTQNNRSSQGSKQGSSAVSVGTGIPGPGTA